MSWCSSDLDLCAFCYTTKIIAGVVAAAAALGIVVGIFFFCRRKKKRQHGPTDASEEERSEEVPLVGLDGGNDISDTIGPMQDEHRDKKLKGLTILNDELYVAFETSPVIEIFRIDISRPTIPTSTRSVNVKDLINPGAIAACARNTCLYIVDKRHDDGKQIIRFDPNGTVICAWKTHKDDRGRISVNHDGNVVMTVYDKHMLKIYSPEGKLETKKTVYFCGWRYLRFCKPTVKYIFHAINLDDGNFILCHGIYKSKLHRVCKVDPTGKVLQSFGGEEGSDEAQLSSPAYLAKRHDGSILVADQKNHRIILLSSELAFEDVLFTKKKHGVSFPTSMYVSEKTGSSLLFLGCNRTESPRGYVSVLKLSQ